jgi:hypothetical protein
VNAFAPTYFRSVVFGMTRPRPSDSKSTLDSISAQLGKSLISDGPAECGYSDEARTLLVMIVGLDVALFTLISDCKFWHPSFIPYVWPSGMMLLGILLILYRE